MLVENWKVKAPKWHREGEQKFSDRRVEERARVAPNKLLLTRYPVREWQFYGFPNELKRNEPGADSPTDRIRTSPIRYSIRKSSSRRRAACWRLYGVEFASWAKIEMRQYNGQGRVSCEMTFIIGTQVIEPRWNEKRFPNWWYTRI